MALNTLPNDLLRHLNSEYSRPLTVSYLNGRMVEETSSLPWSYEDTVKDLLPQFSALLDMGTGNGEFLASLAPLLPHDTCATEDSAPNILLARERLRPLGVTVTAVTDLDLRLPLDSSRFDMITNRQKFYTPHEAHRLLKTNGIFVTQQLGDQDNIELKQWLGEAGILEQNRNLDRAVQELEEVGFTIVEKKESIQERRFYDTGSVLYHLKAIPKVMDFSVENYKEQLSQLHEKIESDGYFVVRSHRFFIIAKK